MRADLHMHSIWSDGSHTPLELAKFCKDAGLALFSLTDHDNMGGSEEAAEAARAYGLRFVRGWEISAYEDGCKVHILGYGCKKGEAYSKFWQKRFEGAYIRADDMRKKANEFFGLDVTMEEIEAYHARKNAPLHTMFVVDAYVHRLNRSRRELYREIFDRGGPAFSDLCRPSPEDAIDVIHACGGVAVLAHPGRMLQLSEREILLFRATQDEDVKCVLKVQSDLNRTKLMDRLVENGLDGIECNYTSHTAEETEYFLAYAKSRQLFVTGGSDFHVEDGFHVVGMPVFEPESELAQRLLLLDGSV